MRRFHRFSTLAITTNTILAAGGVGLLCAAIAAPAFAGDFRTTARPIQGQYIVVLKDSAASLTGKTGRVATIAKDIVATHRATLTRSYDHVLRGFAVRADDAALARLLADPRVSYIQEDGWAVPSATQTAPTWGLDRIDQATLPLSNSYTYENVVTRPHIYIIDTGVLAGHTEFSGRMGNGTSFVADGLGTSDCNGHGTHVAGTAAGTTWGVAKNAIVHPVRIMGCSGTASFSNMIAAMDWVAANRISPAVANLSFNATQIEPALDTAATNLINSGVTLVVAAGNQNVDACQFSPGRVPAAIMVAATTQSDARWSQSAYGSCIDTFAPGVGIRSAWFTSTTASVVLDGTSMAAPHVAGAIARYLNIHPATTPAQMASVMIGATTQNMVSNAGAGTPNRLLFIPEMPGVAPTVSSFVCPDYANSGGGSYWCQIAYSSATPATVRWPNGTGGSVYSNSCSAGSRPTVNVTVGNAYGTVSRSANFLCPSGPIP